MSPRTTIRFDEILAKADDIVAAKQAAAEAAAAAQLAELDNDNELLGGQIVQLLRNAFDAALQDDGQPVDKQLAAAKKLHDQLRDMLALLQGGTAPAALTPEQQFVLAALASGRLVVDDKGGIKDRDWGKLHPRPAATPTPLPADPVIPPATSSKPAPAPVPAPPAAPVSTAATPAPKPAPPVAAAAPAAAAAPTPSPADPVTPPATSSKPAPAPVPAPPAAPVSTVATPTFVEKLKTAMDS